MFAGTGGHPGGNDHKRGDLSRRINVEPHSCDIGGGRDCRCGTYEHGSGKGESCLPQPSSQPAQSAEQRIMTVPTPDGIVPVSPHDVIVVAGADRILDAARGCYALVSAGATGRRCGDERELR